MINEVYFLKVDAIFQFVDVGIDIMQKQCKLEENPEKYIGYVKDKDYYFDGYSHFSIHEEMLKDKIRTKTYMKAIMDNPQLFKDKVVLDVGSGTGILCIFAAKCGAKHVYGVEKANIHIHSKKIIEENKLSHKVTILNGLVEEIVLPVEKVDIIISEWMGYFLLYQGMFDSVLYARDKWLAQDGILLPDRATMTIAVIDDHSYYNKKLNFWNNIYGIKMTCMKKWVLSEPLVDPIHVENIMSNHVEFYDINLEDVKKQQLNFKSQFILDVEVDGQIHGFVSWFGLLLQSWQKRVGSIDFSLQKANSLETDLLNVYDGDIIEGCINVQKAENNQRELNVFIDYKINKEEQTRQYYRIS